MKTQLFAASLALASFASAQTVTSTLTTNGVYGVHGDKIVDSLPAKTVIKDRTTLSAINNDTTARSYARGYAYLYNSGTISAYVRDYGYVNNGGAAGSTASTAATQAPHTLDWTLNSTGSVYGKIVATYIGTLRGDGASTSVSIKVGNKTLTAKADGKRYTLEFPGLTVDKNGVTASITSTGKATSKKGTNAYYSGSLSLVFRRVYRNSTCTVTSGTASCKAGGTATGTVVTTGSLHRLTVNLKAAPKNALGMMLYSPKGDTIDFGTCKLLSQLTFGGWTRTNKDGEATTRLYLRAREEVTAWGQFLTLNFDRTTAGQLLTSNTLKVDCKYPK